MKFETIKKNRITNVAVRVFTGSVFTVFGLLAIYYPLANILQLLFPDSFFQNSIASSMSKGDLRVIVTVVFIALGIALCERIKFNRQKFVSPFSVTKIEIVTYITTSFFLSLTITNINLLSFSSAKSLLTHVLFLLILPSLFVLLPQIVEYYLHSYSSFDVVNLKKLITNFYQSPRKHAYSIFYYATVTLISMLILISISSHLVYKQGLTEKLVITSVNPKKTIVAESIEIQGYNFGWQLNEKDKLNSNYGQIVTSTWEDTRVEFDVPLSMDNKNVSIWIERFIEDNGEENYEKSNEVKIHILSRWDYYPNTATSDNMIEFIQEKVIKHIMRIIYLDLGLSNYL